MDDRAPAVEPLGSQHDRSSFTCGEPALDHYLKQHASQDIRRRVAQVFVAHFNDPQRVCGYYSLSATSFDKNDLPAQEAKRLPHYPVPAAVIGRLAVDRSYQGRGLGEFLLADAIKRTLRAADAMGVHAVVVDAKNERVAAFYAGYGFRPFVASRRRLYLPLQTPRRAT